MMGGIKQEWAYVRKRNEEEQCREREKGYDKKKDKCFVKTLQE